MVNTIDLSTTYLGLNLKNPLVASSSPLTREIEGIEELASAGVSAIVMPSLFEEEIEQEISLIDYFLDYGAESFVEAISFLPEPHTALQTSDVYLKTLREAKKRTTIPIIASLNGATPGGWLKYATMLEEAGADALEVNLYYLATDPGESGQQVEARYLQTIKYAVDCVTIPVAVKLSPHFSSLPHFAKSVAGTGAAGLVLFNRFYQPDIDLDNLAILPSLTLSRPEDLRLPLRWTAILSSQLEIDFAISSGVHSGPDVLKSMMAGANVAMVASELLKNGTGRVQQILQDVQAWMVEHEYSSIKQMQKSMNYKSVTDPASYERANYMQILKTFPLERPGVPR